MNPAIVEALKRLNPAEPAAEAFYVDRPRSVNLADQLAVLLAASQRSRILLHGAIGVGKTTELAAIERRLTAVADVVRVNLAPAAGDVQDISHLLWASLRERVPDLEGALAIWRVGFPKPGLLLLDGLDLLSEREARLVFGPHATLADDRLPAMVVTAPHAIVRWGAPEWSHRFDQVVHVPPFPVITADGTPNATMMNVLADGLRGRLPDPTLIFDEAWPRIAFASGGVPRTALRILRGALLAAAGVGRVNPAHLVAGEREVRHELEQALREGDADALARVHGTGRYDGDARLVSLGAVLPYEDDTGERYWRPHPLLEEATLRGRPLAFLGVR